LIPDSPGLRPETARRGAYVSTTAQLRREAMKRILIGTALAGLIVGTFASLSFATPLPVRLDNGSAANIVQVDSRCGPHHHFIGGFRDRYGHWHSGHCVRNYVRDRGYDRYERGYDHYR
jgi:hypothetical protein